MDSQGEIDERQLLARLQAGEGVAYEYLVRRHADRLYKVACRYVGAEDAKDMLQETFTKVLASIEKFRGDSAIYTWLHQILINTCLSHLRKTASRKEQPIDDLLPTFLEDGHRANPRAAWHRSTESVYQQTETGRLVRNCIDRLPDNYRVVLMLRDIDGFGGIETAELLGISANAVKIRLHRARQALREQLDPHLAVKQP